MLSVKKAIKLTIIAFIIDLVVRVLLLNYEKTVRDAFCQENS
jgi:hypothetical protein